MFGFSADSIWLVRARAFVCGDCRQRGDQTGEDPLLSHSLPWFGGIGLNTESGEVRIDIRCHSVDGGGGGGGGVARF